MRFLKNTYIYIFLFYIFFSTSSFSEVVNKLITKGNERISTESIAIFGDIVLGKNYERVDINLLIKKLYETNFFKNISVDLSNSELIIIVEENPIVNSIIFKGEKAKKNTEKISEILLVREKNEK